MGEGMHRIKRPIRILQVLPTLNFCGGIENYVMNYYRHIDREQIQFDFIVHSSLRASFEQEVCELGGNVYKLPPFSLRNMKMVVQAIDAFFKRDHAYEILHCHMANAAFFYFRIAHRYGVLCNVLHSHNAAYADKLWRVIRNYPLIALGKQSATHFAACSKKAGEFLFSKRPYTILRNAIDVKRFAFDEKKRKAMRIRLQVEDRFVIGHIGRFCSVKNQKFALEVFKHFHTVHPDSVLIFVGDGENRGALQEAVRKEQLEGDVLFAGTQENTEAYYQAFDYFLFPSLHEGFGMALLEAQASGLRCLASQGAMVQDVRITDLLEFKSLEEPAMQWAQRIHATSAYLRTSHEKAIDNAGYAISHEAKNLEKFYDSILRPDLYASQSGGFHHAAHQRDYSRL